MAIKSFCDICGKIVENPRLKIDVWEEYEYTDGYHKCYDLFVCEDCKEKFEKMFADLKNNPGNESVLSYIKRLFGGKR